MIKKASVFLFSNQESEIPEFVKVILIFNKLAVMAHCWSFIHYFHVQK